MSIHYNTLIISSINKVSVKGKAIILQKDQPLKFALKVPFLPTIIISCLLLTEIHLGIIILTYVEIFGALYQTELSEIQFKEID